MWKALGIRRQREDDRVPRVRLQVVRVEGVEAPVLARGADVVDQDVPGLWRARDRR